MARPLILLRHRPGQLIHPYSPEHQVLLAGEPYGVPLPWPSGVPVAHWPADSRPGRMCGWSAGAVLRHQFVGVVADPDAQSLGIVGDGAFFLLAQFA